MASQPESVKAEVFYIGNPPDERPYWGSPLSGVGCNIQDVGHVVEITDVNSLPKEVTDDFTLDVAGFQFLKHKSIETEFPKDKFKLRAYFRECEAVLMKATGATRVVVSDMTIRRAKYGDGNYQAGPATRVHSDQSPGAGYKRVRESMGAEADELLKGRCQIINMWRPIRGPVLDAPLALVDARTVDIEKDCVTSDVIYPDYKGETYAIRHSPNHKWYYMSKMMPDDVLLFKCFDTMKGPGHSVLTPHTAFLHPDIPEGALHRNSIEVRALVFHEANVDEGSPTVGAG